MATKAGNKGTKTRTRSSKQTTKTGTKKGAKRSAPSAGAKKAAQKAAKKGAQASRAGASKAKKSAPVKPAGKKATKAAGTSKTALLSTSGTQISSIQIVPYTGADAEDGIKCRTLSPLNLFPDIIASVDGNNDPVDGKLRLVLKLNSNIMIELGGLFGCNPDGLIYLPAASSNIASIGGPEYLGTPINRIRVKIFSPNPSQVLPFTLAFRLRFTMLAGLPQFPKPFRKRGSITVR